MKLVIGSRGSTLAVAQTEWVARALRERHPNLEIELKRITTTGDKNAAPSFQEVGRKGIFVKELEEALLAKQIDLAVHSLKDMPGDLPPGLLLGPAPRREDPRDCVVSRFGEQLNELPRGSRIGTSSPRRRAQILHHYRDRRYRIEPIRGNIDTRIRKLHDGDYDAIVLAHAGVLRAGLAGEVTQILESEEMMPAAGQGCLALELRENDGAVLRAIEAIQDPNADRTLRAERAFLQGLGGGCDTPVAAHSRLSEDALEMEALLLDVDGERAVRARETGSIDEPELTGSRLAERILYEGGSEILLASHGPEA